MKTTAKLLALALGLVGCPLVGCHEENPRRTAPVIAHSAAVSAVSGSVDAATLALARTARNAATDVAKRCNLFGTTEEKTIRYSDFCYFRAGDVEPLSAASTALQAGAPDAGVVLVFVEHVRLFTEWAGLAQSQSGRVSGTLAHYQELALAWNAFQPQDPIPVDVQGSLDAYRTPDAGANGRLEWQRCASGPCVVVTISR